MVLLLLLLLNWAVSPLINGMRLAAGACMSSRSSGGLRRLEGPKKSNQLLTVVAASAVALVWRALPEIIMNMLHASTVQAATAVVCAVTKQHQGPLND